MGNGYTNIVTPGNGGGAKRSHHINVKELPAEIDWREKVIIPAMTQFRKGFSIAHLS